MTKKHGGDFSRQKLFSTFSMILMPLICGPLIDVVSEYRGMNDYKQIESVFKCHKLIFAYYNIQDVAER